MPRYIDLSLSLLCCCISNRARAAARAFSLRSVRLSLLLALEVVVPPPNLLPVPENAMDPNVTSTDPRFIGL